MSRPITIDALAGNEIPEAGAVFERAFDEPYGEAAIDDLMKPPTSFGLLARRDGVAVGVVVISVAADESEILTIGVSPHVRRTGVAAALMAHAIAAVSERGARKMFLEVAADNAAARALYERLGFRQVGLRRGYYRRSKEVRIDACIMALQPLPDRDFDGSAGSHS